MEAYALLGGPTDLWPVNIKEILKDARKTNNLIVGVDRGSLYLEELGITPDVALGDFDSLKKADLAEIESNVRDIRYSNPVKDLTDSELMLHIVFDDYQIDNLNILGATGGRIDHFLINLLMLLDPSLRQFAEQVSIMDKQNKIVFFNPGRHVIKKVSEYPYIGFAALTAIKDFNILGARYELHHYSGDYPRVFSSNEFLPNTAQFEINFEKGMLAAIYSKDVNRFHNL